MKTDISKCRENFNQAVVHIQIEFDAFFLEGKINDYYTLEANEETGILTLRINNELPKQIEEALMNAFNQSKP